MCLFEVAHCVADALAQGIVVCFASLSSRCVIEQALNVGEQALEEIPRRRVDARGPLELFVKVGELLAESFFGHARRVAAGQWAYPSRRS